MRRILASCGATAVLAAASVGITVPAFAVPDVACVTDCTVTFTPTLGQTTWTVPDNAFNVTLRVAGGSGATYEVDRGGPGGAGGAVTTNVDRAYDGQVLHILAGAAGTSNPGSPPFAGGGSGSYVAAAAGFIAVAGGGGGGGLQVAGPGPDPMMPSTGQMPPVMLTGGAAGFSSVSPNGGNGSDSNDALAYGTGATGAIPGSGSWSPATTTARSVWYGDSGTVASVASDGTITPGLGGLSGRSGGSYSSAADGGGGYAGGGAGTDVDQNDTVTNTTTMTSGPGGGGSGFLAAGLTALSTGPNSGDGSVTITYSIAPATVPGAPTGLTAIPDPESGGAVLTWTAPTDDGGTPITGYVLQRSTDGANWADDASPFSTTFTDYGLQIGTRYYYRIAAENSAGEGAYSTPVSMVSQTYPAYVSDLQAQSGNTTATISWGYPADDGGTPITGYELQYQVNDGSGTPLELPADGWTTASDHATSPFTQTSLANNTLYEFRIRPVNAQGPAPDWSYVEAAPSAPNFQFTPAVTTTSGAPLNNSTVQPGSSFVVTQSGLPAGATLTVTLSGGSTTAPLATQSLARISLTAQATITRTLGTATVNADGELRFASSIPVDLQPGNYALTSELTNAGRDVAPYTIYFTLPAAPTTTGTGTGTRTELPTDGTSAPASTATRLPESLAKTGASDPGWILPSGILLLVAGIVLRVTAHRRRSA